MPDKSLMEMLDELFGYADEERRYRDRFIRELKHVREVVEHLPAEAKRAMGSQLGLSGSASKTHFERIAEFLLSEGNRPQATKAITAATGIPRGTLSQILYRSHRESFASVTPSGFSKRRLWRLSDAAIQGAAGHLQPTLFGREGDFAGLKASDCCHRILQERGGGPMSVLTITREALRRGYKGKATGEEDEVLMTTAKGFWARLGRDERFDEVRPLVFALKKTGQADPPDPQEQMQDGE